MKKVGPLILSIVELITQKLIEIKSQTITSNIITVSIILFFLLIPLSIAQNDPGHDSLYVLKIGNSSISGSLNISNKLIAKQIELEERLFSPYLVIRGDGNTSTATNRIFGTATTLTIAASNEIIIGVGGTVSMGSSGAPTILNVSGALWSQGQKVCLSDGTNCPSIDGENISGIETDPLWTSNFTNGFSGNLNLNNNWLSGDGDNEGIFVDINGSVGIGTDVPSSALEVTGSIIATELCLGGNCQSSWASDSTIFYDVTNTSYDGNMNGYSGANTHCSSEFEGTHLCSVQEILNTINSKNVSLIIAWSGTAWIAGGPPGYTANANDCKGFTSNEGSNLGKFWDFDDTTPEGMGWMTNCANSKPLACCKMVI